MPRAIPEEQHTRLIYVSGLAELACAAGLVRRTRWAAPASVAVLAAVFPANVQMALDSGTGRNDGLADGRVLAWGRLPLQLVMAWAALQARARALRQMEIRVLRPGDDGLVATAAHLFDGRRDTRRRSASSTRTAITCSSPTRRIGPSGSSAASR